MELRQLQCFVTVADELNFRRAAERLHIAQPTVTLQIQRLEREVGLPLFDRSKRPIMLTAAGLRLLPEARDILRSVHRATTAAKGWDPVGSTVLRLGTDRDLGRRTEHILGFLAGCRPDLRVELHQAPASHCLKRVRERQLDAAVVRFYADSPDLQLIPVWRERLTVAVSPLSELEGQPAVRLDDLRLMRLRLVPRQEDPALHDYVVEACRTAGFLPLLGRPSTTLRDTLRDISADTRSWTCLCEGSAAAQDGTAVAFRPVVHPPLDVPASLAVRGLDSTARMLLEACQQSTPPVPPGPYPSPHPEAESTRPALPCDA